MGSITLLFKTLPKYSLFVLYAFGYFLILKMLFLSLMMAGRTSIFVVISQIAWDSAVFAVVGMLLIVTHLLVEHKSLQKKFLIIPLATLVAMFALISGDMMVQALFGQRLVVASALVMVSDAQATASFGPSFVVYSAIMLSSFFLAGISLFAVSAQRFSASLILVALFADVGAATVLDSGQIKSAVWYNSLSSTALKYNLEFSLASQEENIKQKKEDLEKNLAVLKRPTANIKPDIIVIVAESFSASDSKRISGISDKLSEFDKRSRDGLLFTNMISEGSSTDRAYVTLINGFAPIAYSMNEQRYEPYLPIVDTLPKALSSARYQSVFCKTYSLDFIGLRPWLETKGFDEIYGREEMFKTDKRYVWESQPDEFLYGYILKKVSEHKEGKPLFMMATTISTHPPYSSPSGRGVDVCYRYSDKAFGTFYDSLKQSGFFQHGILIITGDHRKITPLEADEIKRYGDSSYGRVAAFAVGYGIRKGIEERPLGLADIHYTIKSIVGSGTVKKDMNNFYTGSFGRDYAIHNLISDRTKIMVLRKDSQNVFDFSKNHYALPEEKMIAQQRAYYQGGN